MLLTDVSRLNSLGYALLQKEPDAKLWLITCGSCSLSETQNRYATIELECLAIQYAISNCRFQLLGLPTFEIITDHTARFFISYKSGKIHNRLHKKLWSKNQSEKGVRVSSLNCSMLGIFELYIFEVDNPRLQRLCEKMQAYNFSVKWVPGKLHLIADALSCCFLIH